MLLGISTASLNGKAYNEDALKWIGDNGIPCAEVFLSAFSEYKPSFGDKLVKVQQQTGIKVTSMHTLNTNFEGQLFSTSPRQKQDAFAIYEDVLQIGHALGAQNYVLHGPAHIKYLKYSTNYVHYAAITDELTDLAARYGITLTWENVHWTAYNHPEFLPKLQKHARTKVHTTLDIKQAMQSGENYMAFLKLMGATLRNVHICDFDEEGMLYLPGEGQVDFLTLFENLKAANYEGPVMIEVYSKCYSELSQLLACYNKLKALMDEVLSSN